MSRIAENIKFLRESKKLSQQQLADALNITRARLGAYEEGRNEPPIELLIGISGYFGVPIDGLIRGDLSKVSTAGLMNVGANRILFPILVDAEGNDLIEVIPQKASAGYTSGYADPEYFSQLPHMKLPFIPVGKHRAFPIKGDSMPPVKEGSYIIGKYTESIKDIKNGTTYIVVTKEDGIVYKRVYSDFPKSPVLTLHSDNKAYAPYQVKAEDVLELWEYTCCLNMTEYKESDLNLESVMAMLRSMQVEMEKIKSVN